MNYKVNEDLCKAFGAHLRKLREERQLSMRQLAEDCDIDHSQIFRIENGVVNTTISMAYAIADGLGITLQELFDFKFPPGAKKSGRK